MKVRVASPQIGEAEIEIVAEALRSGRLTSGPMVAEFEKKFAEYTDTKHAVAVNSGTAALHASLAAYGIEPGDEVIVPALTFFSTVTSAIHQGAVPVFCDISPETYSLDPADLERHITPRTRAVMPVHYFGHCAEMDAIMALAEKHNLVVIEDCAQAHGSIYKGKKVGSIGHAGAFSTFATKHMTTCEGGVVVTDRDDVAEYIRAFRSHGLKGRNDHFLLGYNYRMPEPLGAMGIVQLEKLENLCAAQIEKSEKMISAVEDIPWLTVPHVPAYVRHSYFWCHVEIDEEKLGMPTAELITVLGDKGIEVRNRYVAPLYRQPLLTTHIPKILKLVAGDHLPDYGSLCLPNVERIAGRVIGLPNRPDLGEDEIQYVSKILHEL